MQENEGRINSLDFHRTEDMLVTAGEDDSIHLYNTNTGLSQKTLYSKKHGIHCVTFTHHPNSIVYASNKVQRAPLSQQMLQMFRCLPRPT